jgi:hypothetical protein
MFLKFQDVFEEYKHPDIQSAQGGPLELDYFYPQLKLAVEYQVSLRYGKFSVPGITALCSNAALSHFIFSSRKDRKRFAQSTTLQTKR